MTLSRNLAKIALILVLTPLVFWGCDLLGHSGTRSDISIQPEHQEYTLNPEAQVELTVTNTSESTLYLPVCGPDLTFIVERRKSGTWENYNTPLCRAIYAMGYRRAVEPGASFSITTEISEAGRYRMRLSYKTDREVDDPSDARSGTFTVRIDA